VTIKCQKNIGGAAGLVEAGKQFRRVTGHHMHLPTLPAALQRHVAEQSVGTDRMGPWSLGHPLIEKRFQLGRRRNFAPLRNQSL